MRRLNTQSTSKMSQFYISSFSFVSFSYMYLYLNVISSHMDRQAMISLNYKNSNGNNVP